LEKTDEKLQKIKVYVNLTVVTYERYLHTLRGLMFDEGSSPISPSVLASAKNTFISGSLHHLIGFLRLIQ
jgi:hypothetical protein